MPVHIQHSECQFNLTTEGAIFFTFISKAQSLHNRIFIFILLSLSLIQCRDQVNQSTGSIQTNWSGDFQIKMEPIPSTQTGIKFNNQLYDQGGMNPFVWNFIYTGAGVAAGDLDNDELPDIYFAGNQVADKVYRNKGDFVFEDLSIKAGIRDDLWSTGVTMADVNGDRLLDVYVCKTSPTLDPGKNKNKLYINLGDFKFEESAEKYGIADIGYSTHATFFDFDQDGDLDLYLVNQPLDQFAKLLYQPTQVAAYPSTDRLYIFENERFEDRTREFGLLNEKYGLGISLADYDQNGWTDMSIASDYHQADQLQMNYDGRFTDEIKQRTGHTSFYSMGSDVGDINNDGWADLFVLDMAFEDHLRSKTNMLSMNSEKFWEIVNSGNHYQYAQNTLQLNRGDGTFTEIGQLSGLPKTDWSWAALFCDLDLDGFQDLLVTNGILRDMKDNDFALYTSEKYQGQIGPNNYKEAMTHLPSTPVTNKIYRNSGELQFEDISNEAGFSNKGFSHGMAIADFDLNGKPDIVINNQNAEAGIFRNVSEPFGNSISVSLEGPGRNTHGLGIQILAYWDNQVQTSTMQTTRGYYSSSEPSVIFGIGKATKVDSIVVKWNAAEQTTYREIPAAGKLKLTHANSRRVRNIAASKTGISLNAGKEIPFSHVDPEFNDFKDQVLLPYKLSQNGPHMTSADFNKDKLDDVFIGGAAGQASALFIQDGSGSFVKILQPAFERDKNYEDQQSTPIDYDGDGDLDLYVVSGSNEFREDDPLLKDRLYRNDGSGIFSKVNGVLPSNYLINGESVTVFDLEGDGDSDLFIGGRLIGGKYPEVPQSVILQNENGTFKNVTKQVAPWLESFEMISDAKQLDIDDDGDQDLVLVGEWMIPTIALNTSGTLKKHIIEGVDPGLWWSLESADFDADGDQDLLLGNLGQNNKFSSKDDKSLEIYSADFDNNGDHDIMLAIEKEGKVLPVRGRECSSQEMPFVLEKFPTFGDYGRADIYDILSKDQFAKAVKKKVTTFKHLYLENLGNLNFKKLALPMLCQTGVIKDFEITDYDHDGLLDFTYVGNHFPAEVETARYDGLVQGVALNNGKGSFFVKPFLNLPIADFRDMEIIRMADGKILWLFAQNNGAVISATE